MIRISVEYNKGRGGENAKNKDIFLTALKGMKDALLALKAVAEPDPEKELTAAATCLFVSCNSLLRAAGPNPVHAESSPPDIHELIKVVKNNVRLIIAFINMSRPAAPSEQQHDKLKQAALNLHHHVQELISVTLQDKSCGEGTEQQMSSITSGIADVISLTKQTFVEKLHSPDNDTQKDQALEHQISGFDFVGASQFLPQTVSTPPSVTVGTADPTHVYQGEPQAASWTRGNLTSQQKAQL